MIGGLREATGDAVALRLVAPDAFARAQSTSLWGTPDLLFASTQECWIRTPKRRAEIASIAAALPARSYVLQGDLNQQDATDFALGWALGTYRFDRFRAMPPAARLCWPANADRRSVERKARAVALVRDLVNLPANHCGPQQLEDTARDLAAGWNATIAVTTGDALLAAGCNAIHAVGRASTTPPRLLDLRWGRKGARKLTLIGKGVCFDAGGLNLKSTAGMATMKNDLGGAAQALALAGLLIEDGLDIDLRLLIPAVENSVAGNALRPLDVLQIGGTNVEVTFTDAEGRLVLADALVQAGADAPELVVDFATLTEAAYQALGTELPAMFTNDDELLPALQQAARATGDPLWPMPLYQPYRRHLASAVADLVNFPKGGYADAICAALFLHGFVPPGAQWVHVDFSAWDEESACGEARALLALHQFLKSRFSEDA
jgi:leucyl aminopeptidase